MNKYTSNVISSISSLNRTSASAANINKPPSNPSMATSATMPLGMPTSSFAPGPLTPDVTPMLDPTAVWNASINPWNINPKNLYGPDYHAAGLQQAGGSSGGGGGGGNGGGGGDTTIKKTWIQNYWWVLLLALPLVYMMVAQKPGVSSTAPHEHTKKVKP